MTTLRSARPPNAMAAASSAARTTRIGVGIELRKPVVRVVIAPGVTVSPPFTPRGLLPRATASAILTLIGSFTDVVGPVVPDEPDFGGREPFASSALIALLSPCSQVVYSRD